MVDVLMVSRFLLTPGPKSSVDRVVGVHRNLIVGTIEHAPDVAMVDADGSPASIASPGRDLLQHPRCVAMVLLNEGKLIWLAVLQGLRLGTADVEDVGQRPGIVEGLHWEQRSLNMLMHVLGQHAHVGLAGESLHAVWYWGVALGVRQLEQIGEHCPVSVLLGHEVRRVQEDARVWSRVHVLGNRPIMDVVGPGEGGESSSRDSGDEDFRGLGEEPIIFLQVVQLRDGQIAAPEVQVGSLKLNGGRSGPLMP